MKEKQVFKYKPQLKDTPLTTLEGKRKPRGGRGYFSLVGIESGTGPGMGGSGFVDDV